MIVWLTGQSGAGKTTLADKLCKDNKRWIRLDGDEMRETISADAGFSKKDRRDHNLRVARLAKWLEAQLLWKSNIIVSVIAPMKDVRNELDKLCSPLWIYIKREMPEREGHFYEEPNNYRVIDNDELTKDEAYKKLLEIIDGFEKEI